MCGYNQENLESVLLYIKKQFGMQVFENSKVLQAYFNDLAPKLRKESRVIVRISEYGTFLDLCHVKGNVQEESKVLSSTLNYLINEEYMVRDKARFFINLIGITFEVDVSNILRSMDYTEENDTVFNEKATIKKEKEPEEIFDSSEMEVRYQEACNVLKKASSLFEYNKAGNLFAALYGFKNSDKKAEECERICEKKNEPILTEIVNIWLEFVIREKKKVDTNGDMIEQIDFRLAIDSLEKFFLTLDEGILKDRMTSLPGGEERYYKKFVLKALEWFVKLSVAERNEIQIYYQELNQMRCYHSPYYDNARKRVDEPWIYEYHQIPYCVCDEFMHKDKMQVETSYMIAYQMDCPFEIAIFTDKDSVEFEIISKNEALYKLILGTYLFNYTLNFPYTPYVLDYVKPYISDTKLYFYDSWKIINEGTNICLDNDISAIIEKRELIRTKKISLDIGLCSTKEQDYSSPKLTNVTIFNEYQAIDIVNISDAGLPYTSIKEYIILLMAKGKKYGLLTLDDFKVYHLKTATKKRKDHYDYDLVEILEEIDDIKKIDNPQLIFRFAIKIDYYKNVIKMVQ